MSSLQFLDTAHKLVDAGMLRELPDGRLATVRRLYQHKRDERALIAAAFIGRPVHVQATTTPGGFRGRVLAVTDLPTINNAGEAIVLAIEGYHHRAVTITLAKVNSIEEEL